MQRKTMKKKESKLEDLIQKYYNTTHKPAKDMLLALIKLKDPKFKG